MACAKAEGRKAERQKQQNKGLGPSGPPFPKRLEGGFEWFL